MGEGWHNNHHYFMNSTRQGFYWWEFDMTYYILRALQAVGLVWDIKEPPARVVRSGGAAPARRHSRALGESRPGTCRCRRRRGDRRCVSPAVS